jgi:putative Holliday junction resolvase
MRALGLDLGERTIGVALSDQTGLIATALTVLERHGGTVDLDAVAALCREHGVGEVVLGLPLGLDGRPGPRALATRAFGKRLGAHLEAAQLAAPVRYHDERFSTVRAQAVLLEADLSRGKRKKVIDAVAAQDILQGWLDRQRRSGR